MDSDDEVKTRPLPRILLNAVTAVSLVLCLATLALVGAQLLGV